jgi:hypothetical protein
MVIDRALLLITVLGYGLAQSHTVKGITRSQAEATIEIHHHGQVGSGIILMTGNPTPCGNLGFSTLKETLTDTVTTNLAVPTTISDVRPLTSAPVFHTPLSFGGSRTEMINTTSISQHLYPTIGSSHMIIGSTVSPTLLQTGTSTTSEASNIAKLSTHPYASWYHVLVWVAVIEIMTSFL